MKTEQIDNVWPRDVISFHNQLGRVQRVQAWYGNKNVAEVLFSWHEDGTKSAIMDWETKVLVLASEELTDLLGE